MMTVRTLVTPPSRIKSWATSSPPDASRHHIEEPTFRNSSFETRRQERRDYSPVIFRVSRQCGLMEIYLPKTENQPPMFQLLILGMRIRLETRQSIILFERTTYITIGVLEHEFRYTLSLNREKYLAVRMDFVTKYLSPTHSIIQTLNKFRYIPGDKFRMIGSHVVLQILGVGRRNSVRLAG